MTDVTPSTTWQRVALDLVQKIRAGETPVGSKIASYRRLIVDYNTSLGTVKQAIKYLQDQGIVKGLQGSGLFVIRVPDDDPTFAPTSPEDLAGRVGRVEGALAELQDDRQDVREKIGHLEAAVRDLYARAGRRYPANDAPASRPQRPGRKAADG